MRRIIHWTCRALGPGALVAILSAGFGQRVQAQDGGTALSSYSLDTEQATRWRLSKRLKEISGLAMTPDNRMFAHNDEQAIIYEVDYRTGKLVKAFAMGDALVRGDFEGIAFAGDRFYLVSSGGRLFESAEGSDGERVLYNTYGTGVGRKCEVEGLAFEPSDRSLLLLCKTPRIDRLEDVIAIYRWSLDGRTTLDPPILIPRDAITDQIPGKKFHPSGIERNPESGSYFIVAAREEAIAEITLDGEVLKARALPEDEHRQAEAITFTPDLTLVIADEGRGGRARLTLYSPSAN